MFSYVHNEGILIQCGYYKFNYAHNVGFLLMCVLPKPYHPSFNIYTLIMMITIYQQTQGMMQYPHFY
jgi:hypothetical protein